MQCDRCHTPIPWDQRYDVIHTVRGSIICAACSPNYWQCDNCDGWNRIGDDCGESDCNGDDDGDGDGDDSYACSCSTCRDDRGGRRYGGGESLIQSYSYKPEPVFHGQGPVFLGAEIEVETNYTSRNARTASDHLGSLGYLKSDASISGFEIVTHPMSYDFAMESFPWAMLPALEEGGCDATEATGIHVHVSRDGFTSPCHTYRWLKFIYRNQRDVVKLARRHSHNWAPFTESARADVKFHAKGADPYAERYRAVNVQNADTLELRIFASSLEPVQVQAALGFAAASVEYTRRLTSYDVAHHDGWGWPAFHDWVDNRSEYAPLGSEMEALCAS